MVALNLLSGSLNPTQHPVTKPDFVLQYEQKDITADIAPYLLSLTYTDYMAGQSDELQVEFEDVDGRWLRTWYPEQGDKLSVSLGDQFTGLINWGSFEIAEIEYQQSNAGNTISLKALATGISKSARTLQAKAYEKTTLAQIVRHIAKRLKLNITGTILDIKLDRVTQYQERDVEFLARLAHEYGHSFKIVGQTLVFSHRSELVEREAVAVLLPENVLRLRLRDLIKGVPQAVEIRTYDPKTKKSVSSIKKAKPLRRCRRKKTDPKKPRQRQTARKAVLRQPKTNKPKRTTRQSNKPKRHTTTDTLKIVANKGESQAQLNHRAQAALDDAQDEQCAGSMTLFGNAKIVAGQTIELQNYGKFSGKYWVKQSRHDYSRSRGYTTEIEIKMIEYIAENDEYDDDESHEYDE